MRFRLNSIRKAARYVPMRCNVATASPWRNAITSLLTKKLCPKYFVRCVNPSWGCGVGFLQFSEAFPFLHHCQYIFLQEKAQIDGQLTSLDQEKQRIMSLPIPAEPDTDSFEKIWSCKSALDPGLPEFNWIIPKFADKMIELNWNKLKN